MNNKLKAATALVLFALTAQAATAAVGYNRIAVPAHADVHLTVPFNTQILGSFAVDSVSGAVLSVSGDAMTAGDFDDMYYVRFTSGAANGLWSTISSNGASSLTLADADVAAKVAAGDTCRVYKHHTIDSIFPANFEGVMFVDQTKVLIFENNINSPEQNKSSVNVIRYRASRKAWSRGDTVLEPETQFVLRNDSDDELTYWATGIVPDHAVSFLIAPGDDELVGTGYPMDVKLAGSGLEGERRYLLMVDNAELAQNKSAAVVSRYRGSSGWGSVSDDQVLPASWAFTLRLPSTETTGDIVTITKPY